MTWVLALHLFGVIVWMGSLLTITAMLAMVPDEVGVARERFIVATRHLFEFSTNLGAGLALAMGILLILLDPSILRQGWLHAKLLLVLVVIFLHARLYRRMVALEDAAASATRGEFHLVQSLVAGLLIGIILLTFFRPF